MLHSIQRKVRGYKIMSELRYPAGWAVTRKSDGERGYVVTSWFRDSDGSERVFVRYTDREDYLSPSVEGEPADAYDGKPVYAPDIERAAGRRIRGQLPAFTELGAYPLIYFTSGGNTVCASCATATIDDGNDNDAVTAVDAYYEGPDLQCDECGCVIQSAYGDPDEGEEL